MINIKTYQENHTITLEIEKERFKQLRDLLNQLTFDEFPLTTDNRKKSNDYTKNVNKDETKVKLPDESNKIKTDKDCNKCQAINKKLTHHDHHHHNPHHDYNRVEKINLDKLDETAPYLFLNLGAYEEKRRKLAEERRREYKEYLKEKEKLDAQKSARMNRRTRSRCSEINDYKELLEMKQLEEKKFCQLHNLHLISEDDEQDENQTELRNSSTNFDTRITTTTSTRKEEICSSKSIQSNNLNERIISPSNINNNDDNINDYKDDNENIDNEESEFITPRHRLLSTKTSRIKAMQYKEELLKQMEENRRRKEIELAKQEEEDKKLDLQIAEQQKKMKAEFEEERRRLAQLTGGIGIRRRVNINDSDNYCYRSYHTRNPACNKRILKRLNSPNQPTSALSNRKVTANVGDRSSVSEATTVAADDKEKVTSKKILFKDEPKKRQNKSVSERIDTYTLNTKEAAKQRHQLKQKYLLQAQAKEHPDIITETDHKQQASSSNVINSNNNANNVYFDASQLKSKDDILLRLSDIRRKMHEDHINLLKRIQSNLD